MNDNLRGIYKAVYNYVMKEISNGKDFYKVLHEVHNMIYDVFRDVEMDIEDL